MPMFDFICPQCNAKFEELVFGNENPACPQCGHTETQRQMCVPSPLKTGAFPYPPKPGAVHPLAQKFMRGGQQLAGCGGQCHTCPSSNNGSCNEA